MIYHGIVVSGILEGLVLIAALSQGCTSRDHEDSRRPSNPRGNPDAFESAIDFDNGDFSSQLDSGWFNLEEDENNGFRWISEHAIAYLKNNDSAKCVQLSFYVPEIRNYRNSTLALAIAVDGIGVFAERYDSSGNQIAFAPLPKGSKRRAILRVDIGVDRLYRPPTLYDPRKLAVIVDALKLTSSDTAEAY